MALGGALRPGIHNGAVRHRSSLAVLTRIFETLRLRTYYSLWRFVGPLVASSPPKRRRHQRAVRLSRAAQQPDVGEAPSVTVDTLVAHPIDSASIRRINDSNVVPYIDKGGYVEALSPKPLLERLCIPFEDFHFMDLVKGTTENGDVIISAHIPTARLQEGSGICLDEMGRQLSQLGLVAISACNRRRGDTFYVATEASMEEFHAHGTPPPALTLTGGSTDSLTLFVVTAV